MNLRKENDFMTTKIKLEDIVDGLEMNSCDQLQLVHTRINRVVFLMGEFLRAGENEKQYDHLPEWQQEPNVSCY